MQGNMEWDWSSACSPSPLEESEAPGWFWDTGLDGRRLEAVYTWTDNVTNIQTLPNAFTCP